MKSWICHCCYVNAFINYLLQRLLATMLLLFIGACAGVHVCVCVCVCVCVRACVCVCNVVFAFPVTNCNIMHMK